MNYQSFRERYEPLGVFSVMDILNAEDHFDRKQLVWWQDKGYLKKIINRWYCFSSVQENERLRFFTANHIYSPSYVSLESALAWYALIPEGVYSVTSVTTQKTQDFSTPLGTFTYRHIKPELLFGYTIENYEASGRLQRGVKMAEPEKAILDILYLNPHINTENAFAGLRINKEIFRTALNKNRMKLYLSQYKNPSLEKRVNSFLEFMKHA